MKGIKMCECEKCVDVNGSWICVNFINCIFYFEIKLK